MRAICDAYALNLTALSLHMQDAQALVRRNPSSTDVSEFTNWPSILADEANNRHNFEKKEAHASYGMLTWPAQGRGFCQVFQDVPATHTKGETLERTIFRK